MVMAWLARQARKFGALSPKREAAPGEIYTDAKPAGLNAPDPQSRDRMEMPPPRVPRQGQWRPGRVAVDRDYVAGTPGPHYGQFLRSLPRWIDPLTRDFGDDLYERMLLDDQVSASTWSIIYQVLSEEVRFHPAVDDRRDRDYPLAKLIADFVTRDVADLEGRGLEETLEEMCLAVALGNRVAEKTYEPCEAGRDAGRMTLKKLVVKPRRNVSFVVNAFSELVGIRAIIPGVMPHALPQTLVLDPLTMPNVLPRQKFAVLTFRMRDNDPRGNSLYPPAYEPWWDKRQAAQEFLKALAQFGSPFVWGTTPENAQPERPRDELGNVVEGEPDLEPPEVLFRALQRMKSGGVGAFPFGTQINTLTPGAAIENFSKAMDAYDRRIARAIRTSTRDTMESEHGSRADSETSQDVTGNLIRSLRRWVAHMVQWDLVYWSVLYNWGPEVARRLCPKAMIGAVEHQDVPAMASALTSLKGAGLLFPSQFQWAWSQIGMPPADDAEIAQAAAQQQGAAPGAEPGAVGPAPPPNPNGTVQGALSGLFGGAP